MEAFLSPRVSTAGNASAPAVALLADLPPGATGNPGSSLAARDPSPLVADMIGHELVAPPRTGSRIRLETSEPEGAFQTLSVSSPFSATLAFLE